MHDVWKDEFGYTINRPNITTFWMTFLRVLGTLELIPHLFTSIGWLTMCHSNVLTFCCCGVFAFIDSIWSRKRFFSTPNSLLHGCCYVYDTFRVWLCIGNNGERPPNHQLLSPCSLSFLLSEPPGRGYVRVLKNKTCNVVSILELFGCLIRTIGRDCL